MKNEKNALIILPDFYEYPTYIKKSFEKYGYNVDILFEQPSRMAYLITRRIGQYIGLEKAFGFFNNRLLKKIRSNNKTYDYFLVIRGNIISEKTIAEIHSKYLSEKAFSVYYSWDSFRSMVHKGSIGDSFMKRYTFDSEDVKWNSNYELLPLFYTNAFAFCESEKNFKYDICCLGGFTLERYYLVEKIIKDNPKLSFCIKLYLPKKLYRTKFLTDSRFRNLDFSMITFNTLSQDEVVCFYKQCKVVLDIPSSAQSGLSMRTIESIGMRKKIVTTNPHVMEYPFYSKENVSVIRSGESLKIDESWVNIPATYDENQRRRLSIDEWVGKLLNV